MLNNALALSVGKKPAHIRRNKRYLVQCIVYTEPQFAGLVVDLSDLAEYC